ncbi:hypothetical protein QCA50_008011 [Cerrena zonata]|uniref:LIM zinc-binding domain-containing protein n=1 Tax=Cerrena zonata TaxID=2478898 RepID=A0AAW0GEG9_9APHY
MLLNRSVRSLFSLLTGLSHLLSSLDYGPWSQAVLVCPLSSSSTKVIRTSRSSKQCHIKNFGTRDLRAANLPDRDDVPGLGSPPTSPTRATSALPPTLPPRASPSHSHSNSINSNTNGNRTTSPRLQPTRTLSPPLVSRPSHSPARSISASPAPPTHTDREQAPMPAPSWDDDTPSSVPTTPPRPTTGIPRTVPLSTVISPSPTKVSSTKPSLPPRVHSPPNDTIAPSVKTMTVPLIPASSGSGGYVRSAGVSSQATGATVGGKFGHNRGGGAAGGSYGGTPTCAKCAKVVYFAEQVKALNKTYHKPCLRCSDCKTSLDSTKLTEKDGEPFCRRCYARLFGPQGSGYALLGKPGG